VTEAGGRRVCLSGLLSEGRGQNAALVIVHGLGGNAGSHYCARAAWAAARRGWTSLRLSLRGADGSGEDLYHAGLTADLEAALASPALASFKRLFLLGYSLGGHVTLHAGTKAQDARLLAVASVCAPLDLARGADVLDAPRSWLYRAHILGGLRSAYQPYAARHPGAACPARVRGARTIRTFDSLTVVPRFGFADVGEYYRSQSVAPQLSSLRVPALLAYARHDPVVPVDTVAGHLTAKGIRADVWWIETGGHVGFPPRVAVGGGSAAPLEDQILAWLDAQAVVS
jgi:predicted alpha/beta-fold hydrolase